MKNISPGWFCWRSQGLSEHKDFWDFLCNLYFIPQSYNQPPGATRVPTGHLTLVLKTTLLQEWSPTLSSEQTLIVGAAEALPTQGRIKSPPVREPYHSLTDKNILRRVSWQSGDHEYSENHCPHTSCLTTAIKLVWCPKMMAEMYINSILKLFPSCHAYFWVTYSVVIFIHGKMSIFDNSLLFSMKREHHCLNREKVPFSTVEVNDSVFKLISEEKEVCESSFSCCFYKVHYLKIMNFKDYKNHENLSGGYKEEKNHPFKKPCSEASTNHQWKTVSSEIPCCSAWLTS